jgi:uncharacterized protein
MSETVHNRLASTASPYLLQHADNPVAWQPWDAEALALARRTQRPILLSVGYSACHWCHVMAHESFEDADTAALMNARFVNIKVDREERPDLDRVYQLAHQLMNQQAGGWPLTAFLDPDTLLPFFSGTYFPRSPRHGLPAFVAVLTRIAEVFAERRDELREQGGRMADLFARLEAPPEEAPGLDPAVLRHAARDGLAERYDAAAGGFGQAPKFPMPAALETMLQHWSAARRRGDNDRQALDMVMTTLTRMARGGIFDQLGGGFCRYATDRQWLIPHFEKMLSDNGLLLALYSDALGVGPDPLFEHVVDETAGWLLREMRDPEGAWYAAQDADSEGAEGRYYVWRRAEVQRLLDPDEYLVIETLYGLDRPAHFEGGWILHRTDAWRAVTERLSLEPARAEALLASARAKLLTARNARPRPGTDNKILCGWNALAIRGLARAAVRRGRDDWLTAAQRAADFLRGNLWLDGVLHASWREGRIGHPAFLDDHALLIGALLTLLSARWRDVDVMFARQLADSLLARFEDNDNGGFYFTAHDQETLIHRPKPVQDDAIPAGNATAAAALHGLGALLAEPRYLESASRTIDWALAGATPYPAAHCAAISAAVAIRQPGELILLRGPEAAMAEWQRHAQRGYRPDRAVYAVPYEGVSAMPPQLPRLVSANLRSKVLAYVCEGTQCGPPIDSLAEFQALMDR